MIELTMVNYYKHVLIVDIISNVLINNLNQNVNYVIMNIHNI